MVWDWDALKKETTIVCKQCGDGFAVPTRTIKYKNTRKFCSKKCYTEWQKENVVFTRKRTSSPRKQLYSRCFTRAFKDKIRRRDNYTCMLCGEYGACVHHIDYDKANTTEDNCTTLCRSCHGKTNTNREYWEMVLSNKVSTMYDGSILAYCISVSLEKTKQS